MKLNFMRFISILIGVIVVLIALIIHEFGHALTALILGGEITAMRFWGISLYPKLSYT